jgi:hypothetical protein
MEHEDPLLIHNEKLQRFELKIDKHTAFINYKQKDEAIYLVHTEVPKDLESQGVAAALVEKTFQYLEKNKLKLVPVCSYIKVFLERNPQWNTLLKT